MPAKIENLRHAIGHLPHGGMVLLLNTGAILTPEDVAMLQALYSRDPGSIYAHLEKLAQVGSGKFMEQFYVGYAHKSIGDCGTVTLFIEGVSMLAAKAIQDWQLYSGQEVSTRYVDFSVQPFTYAFPCKPAKNSGELLRSFYVKSLPLVEQHLTDQFPRGNTEQESVYKKAIKARAFDIMRGFLPAGAMTSLSWHGDLRQIADKLGYLRHHPLQEVRDIARAMFHVLKEGAPNSFGHKMYSETEKYNEWWMKNGYYFDPPKPLFPEFEVPKSGILIDKELLFQEYGEILINRPAKTELPTIVNECGTIRVEWLIDFGSYRDVQRHRAVNQRMPRLSTKFGFHEWYLEQLPSRVREEAVKTVLPTVEKNVEDLSEDFFLDPLNEAQYLIPMGYKVPNRITGGLASLIYLVELRSTVFVHPTLQVRARQLGKRLQEIFKNKVVIHIDEGEVGRFDARRGLQDIKQK
jgi:thymidylate synthase ThyX